MPPKPPPSIRIVLLLLISPPKRSFPESAATAPALIVKKVRRDIGVDLKYDLCDILQIQ